MNATAATLTADPDRARVVFTRAGFAVAREAPATSRVRVAENLGADERGHL